MNLSIDFADFCCQHPQSTNESDMFYSKDNYILLYLFYLGPRVCGKEGLYRHLHGLGTYVVLPSKFSSSLA